MTNKILNEWYKDIEFRTILNLTQKHIYSIDESTFRGLDNLIELDLSENQLIILPENIFEDLSSLKYLNLNENNLISLQENVFAGLSSLFYLHLKFNKLTSLPDTVFHSLISLRTIDLSQNKLANISEDSFVVDRVSINNVTIDMIRSCGIYVLDYWNCHEHDWIFGNYILEKSSTREKINQIENSDNISLEKVKRLRTHCRFVLRKTKEAQSRFEFLQGSKQSFNESYSRGKRIIGGKKREFILYFLSNK